MKTDNIQAGINLFKSGDKIGARQVFLDITQHEPNNEVAWLWLAACIDKPEQKRDCFYKILSINPNNQNAQKALAELELQTLSDAKPIPQSGTVLKCPSCGSVMGKPDSTGLIQCGYCGTTITYQPPVEKIERKNVERLLEICKTSLDGKNYKETIEYANKILEIDPENFDAWINKAIATFWLTTVANNRYSEATGYVLKAEEIDKGNPTIEKTREFLRKNQATWYLYLANQEVQQGNKIFKIYANTSIYNARNHSREYYIKAMNYDLLALQFDTQNYTVLQSIKALYSSSRWINWNSEVQSKVGLLKKMEQRNNAIQKLSTLQNQLKNAQENLAKTEKEKGLFGGMKIEGASNKINSLKKEIAKCEQIINSQ